MEIVTASVSSMSSNVSVPPRVTLATCDRPQVHRAIAMVLGSRVGLQHAAHIKCQVCGTLARGARKTARAWWTPVSTCIAGTPAGDGTHNVGLKAVAHCHRVRGTNELARTAIDTRLGLATGSGTLAGRVLNRTHQRAIAECLAALDGQGRVKVRGIRRQHRVQSRKLPRTGVPS